MAREAKAGPSNAFGDEAAKLRKGRQLSYQ